MNKSSLRLTIPKEYMIELYCFWDDHYPRFGLGMPFDFFCIVDNIDNKIQI